MKWRDPMPTHCPACGGRFPVPAAALRSLRAVCPGCGASLAAVGERMLAVFAREQARFRREIGPFLVGFELEEEAHLGIPDSELDTPRSLNDLVRAVAGHLPPAADREARAAELVADAARRSGYAWLLGEADSDVVRAWLGLGASGRAEPDTAPDPARDSGSGSS
jgi:hypothetical protein